MPKRLKRLQRLSDSRDALSTMFGYVLIGALGAGAASLDPPIGVVVVALGAAAATVWTRYGTRRERVPATIPSAESPRR